MGMKITQITFLIETKIPVEAKATHMERGLIATSANGIELEARIEDEPDGYAAAKNLIERATGLASGDIYTMSEMCEIASMLWKVSR